MPKLTDMQIRAWIKAGERFEGRSDGNGLYLSYRENYQTPVWRFRYKFAGKPRAMLIGSYAELSLSKARETAKELSARVALGYDVAGEKQERKSEALAKMEAEKNAMRVSELAAEYFERQILPRWKHPDILRRRIDKDINPCIGSMKVEDVKPRHIDDMLKGIVDRGAPTIATDVLRWTRRIFDYGIKRHALEIISPDVIKACALAVRAYGVYEGNPMKMIEQQILGTLQGRIYVAIAQQNISHPVLNEIGLTIPQETGVLPELKRSPAKRMQVALELKEKRQRMQQKGTKS